MRSFPADSSADAAMAAQAAHRCFYNALIREAGDWLFVPDRAAGGAGEYQMALAGGARLCIGVRRYSHAGRHHFCGSAYLQSVDGRRCALSLTDSVPLALAALGIAEGSQQRMLARFWQSCDNIAANLKARRRDLDALAKRPLNFIEAEGGLLIGHSLHPCPKARDNFVGDDAARFAPEYAADFALLWLAVKREHLAHFAAEGYRLRALISELAGADPQVEQWLAALDDDEELLPCHPFQWRYWQRHPVLAERLVAGSLRLLGEGKLPWRATSSLRAIYCETAPWMLKFSLNVKLTNSLRTLQAEELARGAQLAEVLNSERGREFQRRFPQMSLLLEPLGCCMVDDAGEPIAETGLLWRANPFLGAAAEHTEVLATLLQDDPRSGESRLVQRLRASGNDSAAGLRQWFAQFLEVAVRPLLLAQANFGLLFGAHQQNLVLRLKDGIWPEHMYFRDCQGTGFSALAERQLGLDLRAAGSGLRLIDATMTATLFSYYLFINATFNVISSLAMSGQLSEAALIAQLRAFLDGVRCEGVADDSVIRYLLESPELQIKANFYCALEGLNENTHGDILSLYRPINNPLKTELN